MNTIFTPEGWYIYIVSVSLQVKEGLVEKHKTLKVGDVENFENFMSAVIDKKSFDRVSGYIEHAKQSPNTSIVAGGTYDER